MDEALGQPAERLKETGGYPRRDEVHDRASAFPRS
jgi:hypothetical protein